MSLETGFRNDRAENEEEKSKMLKESISRIEEELANTKDEEKRDELTKALEDLKNK